MFFMVENVNDAFEIFQIIFVFILPFSFLRFLKLNIGFYYFKELPFAMRDYSVGQSETALTIKKVTQGNSSELVKVVII